MTPEAAPRTAAGRALLQKWERGWFGPDEFRNLLLAIEAEASSTAAALPAVAAAGTALLRDGLTSLIAAVEPYAFAPTHGTPRGTRQAVKRAVANAKRRLDGLADYAICGSLHEGFTCERPKYHTGKHRHSARLAGVEREEGT